jgi:anti-sigma regulatory factor (Ser/Thr protein kinase)
MAKPESPLSQAFEAGVPATAGLPSEILIRDFAAEQVTDVRHAVREHAGAVGLTGDDLFDFVVAVHELVINAVMHGGGRGRLRLRRSSSTVVAP